MTHRGDRQLPRAAISVRVIDLLATDRFHLNEDDAFLVRAFQAGGDRVHLTSSPSSVVHVAALRLPGVVTTATIGHEGLWARLKPRFAYWCRALAVPRGSRQDLVLLQSFEETSALLLSFILRSRHVVPIFTNNIALIETKTLKRAVLRRVLRRAQGIVVYSDYEQILLAELFPESAGKLFRMRFHKPGTRRPISDTPAREPLVSYIGWSRYDKGMDRVLAAAARYEGELRFGVFGEHGLSEAASQLLRDRGAEVTSGYLDDHAYEQAFLRSRAVILPYSGSYQGKLSGIFCDAIATETPVIVPRIEPFIEFFARYGDLGIFLDFDDQGWWSGLDEMLDESRYAEFRAALRRAREDHAFEAVARDFRRLRSLVT